MMQGSVLALLLSLASLAAPAQNNPQGPPAGPNPQTPRGEPAVGSRLRLIPGLRIDLNRLFAADSTEVRHEPGQVLVLWPDVESANAGLAWIAQREQLVPAEQHALAALGGMLALFQLSDDAQARGLRDRLRAAQPHWVVDLNARATAQQRDRSGADAAPAANAPPRLYALAMLGLKPAALTLPALRVGVIDSALDPAWQRPEAAQVWNGSTLQLRSMLGPTDVAAADSHGQQVAMLLAGAALSNGFVGAAPAVHLHWAIAMRRSGQTSSTHSLLLARALDWLVGQQVQLINLSAGGAGDDILRTVVAQVLARGVTLLAAAGNRPDTLAVYPAAYAGVWAVTAVDATGQAYAQASRATHVSFAAPGVDVWVPDAAALAAVMQSSDGRYVSGTSYATALASGAVARLGPEFWRLEPAARRQRLCDQARRSATEPSLLGCGLLRLDLLAEGPFGRP